MRTCTLMATLAALVLCLLAVDARAGGSTTSIFGSRRNGMLTVIGAPDDLSAVFHNPAGLANLRGTQAFVFVSPAFLSSTFRMQALDTQRFPELEPAGCGTEGAPACPWPVDSEGYYTRKIEPERYFGLIPFLGLGTDLGFLGPRAKDIYVAAALYAPNFYGAFLPEDAPTAYSIIGGYFVVISATGAVGWRLNRYISVGANLSYNYMYLTMAQRISLADALTPAGEQPGSLATAAQWLIGDIRMDYKGSEHGMGWAASVLLNPTDWLGIGLTYSGNTNPEFRGDVHFSAYNEQIKDKETFRELVNDVGYKLPTGLVIGQPLPHALFFGFNIKLHQQVELGLDGRLWFYNQFKRQTLRPIYDPEEKGTEPMTEESMSRDKRLRLSWQFTAGLLVRPVRSYPNLELLAGSGYDLSPIPDQTLTLDNPNLSHIKVAAGVRWRINARLRLAATYLLNLYTSRDIRDSETSPPTNVQITSHSHSPALSVDYTF